LAQNKFNRDYSLQATVLVDTGAGVSVVTNKFLASVKHQTRYIAERNFLAANGKPIGNNLFATFNIQVSNFSSNNRGASNEGLLTIKDALIINDDNVPVSHILLGTPELSRTGAIIDFEVGEVSFRSPALKVDFENLF